MLRRRMLMEGGSDIVKEWVNILSDTKPVQGEITIEFDLLSGSTLFDEFVIYLQIAKHSGENECSGNVVINLNGRSVGYFAFNNNWKQTNMNYYIEAKTKPIPNIKFINGKNSLQLNLLNVRSQNNFNTNNSDSSKFIMKFPSEYTGTIDVEIFAR